MISNFVYSFNTMSCTVSPLFRFVGRLLPVYRADLGNFQPKSYMFKFFVTDFSASTGGNDFKFCIQLQHDELYHASPFQVCRSPLPVYRADSDNFHIFQFSRLTSKWALKLIIFNILGGWQCYDRVGVYLARLKPGDRVRYRDRKIWMF